MLRIIKQVDSQIPVVIYSAWPDVQERLAGTRADRYVLKSSDLSELVSNVKEMIRSRVKTVREPVYRRA